MKPCHVVKEKLARASVVDSHVHRVAAIAGTMVQTSYVGGTKRSFHSGGEAHVMPWPTSVAQRNAFWSQVS